MTTTDTGSAPSLRREIERLLEGTPVAALRQSAARLTEVYRGAGAPGEPAMRSAADRLAYVAARMPATFEATRNVLAELQRRCPELNPGSLLELGAGPAPGLWAASGVFTGLSRATHVEIDRAMVDLGRRLLAAAPLATSVESSWRAADLASGAGAVEGAGAHDLVLLGYVLGELPEAVRPQAVDGAWGVAREALVIVEPGTPAGAARVMAARARLMEQGATVAAPCPHDEACPLPAADWCHFGARLNRSRAQRLLKGGSLPYEDEKYAYVAVTRTPGIPCAARVLRRPVFEPRRVSLHLCAAAGLRRVTITRRQGQPYRTARKLAWGDAWEPPGQESAPSGGASP